MSREPRKPFIERPLAVDQRVEYVDEKTVRLRVSVPDTLELRRWLFGFGPLARVRSPANLRNDQRGLIQQMQESYASD